MFGRNRISEDVQDWLTGQFDWAVAAGVLSIAESAGKLTSRMKKALGSSYKQLENLTDTTRLGDKRSARAA